jgi:hypothetical protein
VVLNRLPRMADHAKWIRACEGAYQQEGLHMEAYDRNRAEATEIVLEADRVAMALRAHMDTRSQTTTTSTDLLTALSTLVPENVRRSNEWGQNARALAGRLRRSRTPPSCRSWVTLLEGTPEICVRFVRALKNGDKSVWFQWIR